MSEEGEQVKEAEPSEEAKQIAMERRRLLGELAKKGDFKKEIKRSSEIEDPEALIGLYHSAIKMPQEPTEVEAPPEPVEPINIVKPTAGQLQSMRQKSAAEQEKTLEPTIYKKIADFLIQIWFDIGMSFIPKRDPKPMRLDRPQCDTTGHVCKHCNEKIMANIVQIVEKD